MTQFVPAKVPVQGQTVKDGGGKHVSDFISADTYMTPTGAVVGTLKYNKSITSFSGQESKGYYFPLTLDEKYGSKEITVKRDGQLRNKATDLEWLLYVPSTDTKFTFETDEDGTFLTVDFVGAKLAPPTGKDAVSVDLTGDFGGCGQAKDWMEGVAISWDDETTGHVTGKFKKSKAGTTSGSYQFAIKLDEFFEDKTVNVILTATTPWENMTSGHITISKEEKKSLEVKVKMGETLIAKLDFTQATFDEGE